MMKRVMHNLIDRFTAVRRQHPAGDDRERVEVVNRQWAAAARLARYIHSTPEELLRIDGLRDDATRAGSRLTRGPQ